MAYNGIKVTHEGLSAPSTAANSMPTLDHWHKIGGLVARGVLIDYKAWWEARAAAQGKSGEDAICHPFDGHRITVADIEEIARDQGVEFRPGDVLVIRTGYTETMAAAGPGDWAKLEKKLQLSGMHGCMESVRWLWDRHFAAVASDAIAFEALLPVNEDGTPAGLTDLGKSSAPPWLPNPQPPPCLHL